MNNIATTVLSLVLFVTAIDFEVTASEMPPSSFAYVLQPEQLADSREAAISKLAGCDRDWIILDVSFGGDEQSRWTATELQTIRQGKAGRKVIAYLSIGEAEDYRSYWKPSWKQTPPDFLLKENPDWAGNYSVKFWTKAWQQIILDEIDKITTQGFDGLYLDKVDIFEDFEYDPERKDWIDHRINPATKHSYRKEMIAWVQAVAKRARMKNRAALVIPQNGSPLLEDRSFRQAISGIGIEDLFTDGEQKQDEEEIKYIIGFLKKLKKENKPILCIEYPEETKLKIFVRKKAKRLGCRLLITDRELTTLGEAQ